MWGGFGEGIEVRAGNSKGISGGVRSRTHALFSRRRSSSRAAPRSAVLRAAGALAALASHVESRANVALEALLQGAGGAVGEAPVAAAHAGMGRQAGVQAGGSSAVSHGRAQEQGAQRQPKQAAACSSCSSLCRIHRAAQAAVWRQQRQQQAPWLTARRCGWLPGRSRGCKCCSPGRCTRRTRSCRARRRPWTGGGSAGTRCTCGPCPCSRHSPWPGT